MTAQANPSLLRTSLSVSAAASSGLSDLVDLSAGGTQRSFSFRFCTFAIFSFLSLHRLTQIAAFCLSLISSLNGANHTQYCCWTQLTLVLRFLLSVPSGHSGQVASFFPNPVPLWTSAEGKLGKPVVDALVWKLDVPCAGPYTDVSLSSRDFIQCCEHAGYFAKVC